MSFRNLLGATPLIAVLSISSLPAHAGPQFAIALQGYDAVSFFEPGSPIKGEFDSCKHPQGRGELAAPEPAVSADDETLLSPDRAWSSLGYATPAWPVT